MSQALYRKWRPRLWDEVVGQEQVVQTLRNAISGERVAHAYLFAGPRGTGKTTSARLLAKAVNCLAEKPSDRPCNQCLHCQAVNDGRFMDLIEIDAASNTSVEDVRSLRDKINFAPTQGTYKVYIIDEVHMLSTAAFNALLKTLEEPPPHAIFILATTEVHKIPATVLSRCQRHEFRRIPVMDITRHLKDLADQEKLEVEPEALTLIARQATGAMRDAISLLDQLASSGKKITLEMAHIVLGTATSAVVVELIGALLTQNPAEGLTQIHRALDAGTDPRQFARQVVEYLRGLLLVRMGSAEKVEASPDLRSTMAQHARAFDMPRLLLAIRAFNQAATDLRGGWHPGLLLELAFAESLEQPSPPMGRGEAIGEPASPSQANILPAAPSLRQAEPATGRGEATGKQAVSAKTNVHPEPSPVRPAETAAGKGEAPKEQAIPTKTNANQNASPPRTAGESAQNPLSGEASPAAPAETAIGFPSLMQQWPRVRALIKKHSPQTEALLNSAKLNGIKDGTLLLAFSPVLKQKMEGGTHLDITSRAIAHVTGVTLEVKCVLLNTGKAGSGLPPDVEVEDDGIVGTALRDLGGEVVDVQ